MKYQRAIIYIILFLTQAAIITGCSSQQRRTKWTDPTMRVMIDPDSIPAKHHVRIQSALVQSNKWVVIDRAAGFRAIKAEQERLHRYNIDRFDDKEKWTHWGKLYGVRGIIVGHVQCTRKRTFLFKKLYTSCLQYLSIIDANSGKVLAAIENKEDGDSGDYGQAPSWEDSVEMLADSFPEYFERDKSSDRLNEYRDLSKERAIRQKRNLAADQVKENK